MIGLDWFRLVIIIGFGCHLFLRGETGGVTSLSLHNSLKLYNKAIVDEKVVVVIQVQGKRKGELEIDADIASDSKVRHIVVRLESDLGVENSIDRGLIL